MKQPLPRLHQIGVDWPSGLHQGRFALLLARLGGAVARLVRTKRATVGAAAANGLGLPKGARVAWEVAQPFLLGRASGFRRFFEAMEELPCCSGTGERAPLHRWLFLGPPCSLLT